MLSFGCTCTTLIFLLLQWIISLRSEKISDFFCLNWFSHVSFPFVFWCFLKINVIHYSEIMKILLYLVLFCPLKSKINSFWVMKCLGFCRTAKKNYNFLFLLSFTHQVEFFLRGMPVAYHRKNPAGFVFLCMEKLQS